MERLRIARDYHLNIIKRLERCKWWTLLVLALVVFFGGVYFDSVYDLPVVVRVLIICFCYFLIYLSTFASNRFIQRCLFKVSSWTSKHSIWAKCIVLFITYIGSYSSLIYFMVKNKSGDSMPLSIVFVVAILIVTLICFFNRIIIIYKNTDILSRNQDELEGALVPEKTFELSIYIVAATFITIIAFIVMGIPADPAASVIGDSARNTIIGLIISGPLITIPSNGYKLNLYIKQGGVGVTPLKTKPNYNKGSEDSGLCRRVSTIRWIRRDAMQNIIERMAEYLEGDLPRLESCKKIPWASSNTPFRVIELMPTFEGQTYSIKYINEPPFNPANGYQTGSAFGMLGDVDNGYPTFLAEMTLLTALRTAAISAMAAKHLARPNPTTMAMIGTGSQGEFQALGFRGLLGINTLRVYDIDPQAMDKLVRNLGPLGFRIAVCDSVDEAVEGADIITTCTADKAQNAILHDAQVRAGVHLNAVGGDCPGKTELDPAIRDRSTVFVEFPRQTRAEGEIQQQLDDLPAVEFSKVLTGAVPGRQTAEEITLFDSVSSAIVDGSALKCLREMTAGSDLQTEIDLIADPEDRMDLFSLVTVRSPVR